MIGCKHIWGVDDILSLERRDYHGNELRTDGYYYTKKDSYEGIIYSKYALYRNGVIRYIDGSKFIQPSFGSNKYKYDWGVFKIENGKILFECWQPGNGGALKSYVNSGEILNDTTFVIKEIYRMHKGQKTDARGKNEVYHFVAYSPKPDSTNNFVK